ncbi:MAG: ArsR family transcriptional regulator [Candidatus Dormibacteraeota bacterium]|nr:ArsR family transcriptional regulator [Candidatus Dormibacteraeota bacterium]
MVAVAGAPGVLRLLAHDVRWTIVRELAQTDLGVSELVGRTGQAPSLVSYHLARLRGAGLVSARRSAADARDSYYTLDLGATGRAMDAMARAIHPGLLGRPAQGGTCGRVLFICSGNSSRSQMAEGWLRHLGGPGTEAVSAGTAPSSLHPLAVEAMREHGVDISGQRAKHVDLFRGQDFDRVVTLCDRAREACPELPGARVSVHWSILNPADAHPPDLDAYRATAREVGTRVGYLLPLLGQDTDPVD